MVVTGLMTAFWLLGYAAGVIEWLALSVKNWRTR